MLSFRKKTHLSIGTTMIIILITRDSHQTFTVWVVCQIQGVTLVLMRALFPGPVNDTRTRHHTLREIRRNLKKVGVLGVHEKLLLLLCKSRLNGIISRHV